MFNSPPHDLWLDNAEVQLTKFFEIINLLGKEYFIII